MSEIKPVLRFSQDMDGEMELHEYGRWVYADEYDDAVNALRARVAELEAALGEIAWSTDGKWQADRARAALEGKTND